MRAADGRRRAEGGRWRAEGGVGSGLVVLRTPYFVLRTLSVFSALRLPPSALIYLAFLAVLWFAAAACAADPPHAVWLVGTRGAPHCGELDGSLESLRYWRLTEDCDWSSANAKDFHATDDAAVPTVVFIPGNRTDADEAVVKGWYAYEAIQSQSGGRALRYVIWSWPADRVGRRNRPDVQLKAAYSDVESYYLALWLNNLRPGAKVSLVGHSFGPRIITGAMHLLAGGEVAGQTLPEDTVAAWAGGKRNPVRAVLLGAAEDADALAPDGADGLALSLFDRVLITCNCCDRVLRWYPRLYGRGGPQAMGRVGPCGVDGDGSERPEKVDVVDVSATVGKVHDWRGYCSAPEVCSQWAFYAFLDDAAAQP